MDGQATGGHDLEEFLSLSDSPLGLVTATSRLPGGEQPSFLRSWPFPYAAPALGPALKPL